MGILEAIDVNEVLGRQAQPGLQHLAANWIE